MVYQVLSTSCCERVFGHDALELIRLKWETFRFQILWRKNLANYVFVTGYVLKCVYFHLLSLKRRKRDFWFSEFVFFSQNYVKSLTSQESRKHAVSSVIDELRRTVWRPWCSRRYRLEIAKISISNFIAPKCCQLRICNCLCA